MGQLFPVLAYDPKEFIFHLEKSSLGFGFMCAPVTGCGMRSARACSSMRSTAPVGAA